MPITSNLTQNYMSVQFKCVRAVCQSEMMVTNTYIQKTKYYMQTQESSHYRVTIATVAVYAARPTYDINCFHFMMYQEGDEHTLCLSYAGIQSIVLML